MVLVRRDAETSDIAALESATGLLTQRGARTSRAAVVARQLGKVCLVGCTALQIDETARTLHVGAATLHDGDVITLDGNEGVFYAGAAWVEIKYPEDLRARLDAPRQREPRARSSARSTPSCHLGPPGCAAGAVMVESNRHDAHRPDRSRASLRPLTGYTSWLVALYCAACSGCAVRPRHASA